MMPKRIQRQRTKGWRMPEGAIYVGRPTKWGNPFKVGAKYWDRLGEDSAITPEKAVYLFRRDCDWRTGTNEGAPSVYTELRGHDLACWCPLEDKDGNPAPCHADVLLEWAKERGTSEQSCAATHQSPRCLNQTSLSRERRKHHVDLQTDRTQPLHRRFLRS